MTDMSRETTRASGILHVRPHLRPTGTKHGACLLFDFTGGGFECEVIRLDYATAIEVEGEA
jgi:hypothetical protein